MIGWWNGKNKKEFPIRPFYGYWFEWSCSMRWWHCPWLEGFSCTSCVEAEFEIFWITTA